MKNRNRVWTEEKLNAAKRHLANGMSREYVASLLNVSKGALKTALWKDRHNYKDWRVENRFKHEWHPNPVRPERKEYDLVPLSALSLIFFFTFTIGIFTGYFWAEHEHAEAIALYEQAKPMTEYFPPAP